MEVLSVIIPTYGRVGKIQKAIDSILIDNCFEVIVIDDNGEGTSNQVSTYNTLFHYIESGKIKYYPLKQNSGASFSRNFGIAKATGDYITFLDDDDYFLPGALLKKFNFFKNDTSEFDICCSHMRVKKNNEFISSNDDKFVGSLAKDFLLHGCSYTSMIMIKKSSILGIGGFISTPYLQDHTLMLKAHINNLTVCVYDDETFVHTIHGEETITNGKRPICGVVLRAELEKELSKKLDLNASELQSLNYRWNTINFYQQWLNYGVTYSLCKYLLNNVMLKSQNKSEYVESIKLVFKMLINYKYYTQ